MFISSLGIGLLSSGTHCTGMCGPIHLLLRQSGVSTNWYHLGRISGYTLQGLVVASIGATLSGHSLFQNHFPSLQWIVPVLLGAVYLILSLEFLGVPVKLEQHLGKFFPHHRLQKFLKTSQPSAVVSAGFVAAFLPCPSTLGALSLALLAATPWIGSLYMLVFGLGTLPAFALLSWKPLTQRLNHTRVLRMGLGLYFVFISAQQWMKLWSIVMGYTDTSCH